eukprot:355645-Chlamydomonas_euryale.AAC.12
MRALLRLLLGVAAKRSWLGGLFCPRYVGGVHWLAGRQPWRRRDVAVTSPAAPGGQIPVQGRTSRGTTRRGRSERRGRGAQRVVPPRSAATPPGGFQVWTIPTSEVWTAEAGGDPASHCPCALWNGPFGQSEMENTALDDEAGLRHGSTASTLMPEMESILD